MRLNGIAMADEKCGDTYFNIIRYNSNRNKRKGESMVKDGWVYCPICNNKTRTKIRPDTVAKRFPVFCPVCKNESIMNIENGKAEIAK